MSGRIFRALLCAAALFPALAAAADTTGSAPDFRILFRTSGQVTVAFHVTGKNEYTDMASGYRSDILLYTDLIGYRELCFNFLSGYTTTIARLPETPVKMDKIRYSLSPGFRYPFRKTLLSLHLFHECIHTISREELDGSTWWNSVQLSGGTKGAYPFHLIEKYNNRDFSLRSSFDAMGTVGAFLRGHAWWVGRRHDYLYDFTGLLRYHTGFFRDRTLFLDLKPHFWYDDGENITSKLSAEINYVILARNNMATLYYSHCFLDDNPHDNEYSLGAVGFKVVF